MILFVFFFFVSSGIQMHLAYTPHLITPLLLFRCIFCDPMPFFITPEEREDDALILLVLVRILFLRDVAECRGIEEEEEVYGWR